MRSLSEGRIIFASGNHHKVICGDEEYLCALSGSFYQKTEVFPAVGDFVRFYRNPGGESLIEEIMPRRTVIARKTPGREFAETVLAANVDIMLIVCAMDRSFSRNRIERFLVLAKGGGARPVTVLTKSDLCPPMGTAVYLMEAEEVMGGQDVFAVSSVTGEGIAELEALLTDKITACAVGLSGAGKSSLLNRLAGEEMAEVSEVRKQDSRGRHTTTARHIFTLKSGAAFIDTPGIREVGMTGDADALELVFDEINTAAAECFFSDCTHTHEPGCAVKELTAKGEIKPERYANYLKLRKENEQYILRTEDTQKKKREDKKLSRMVKAAGRHKKRFKD